MTSQPLKSMDEIKADIQREIVRLDQQMFSDSIITINLKIANMDYGIDAKNALIDKFGLEKLGWKKDSEEIQRYGEFDLPAAI